MDKTLSRKILFDKKKTETTTPKSAIPAPKAGPTLIIEEEKPQQAPKLVEEEDYDDMFKRSGAIAEWIKTHPMFAYSTMCKELGLDPGNFYKWVLVKKPARIKPENVLKIEKILKNYGYSFTKK